MFSFADCRCSRFVSKDTKASTKALDGTLDFRQTKNKSLNGLVKMAQSLFSLITT